MSSLLFLITFRQFTKGTSQKRIKLFEYLKSYIATNGFVFLQETHSTFRDEKKWEDEFRGKFFFSHGKQIDAEF